MYAFVSTSDYLPSADKWLMYIYCIILANTLRERYRERRGSVVECLTQAEGPRVRASPASLRCGP